MKVEVAYAVPDAQVVVAVELPPGATIEQAIAASGLLQQFPQIDLRHDGVGIFGERRVLTDIVTDGDRVEIYRPLKADPKDQRRQRARKKRSAR